MTEIDETAAVTTETAAGTAVETATTTGTVTGGVTTETERTATVTIAEMTATATTGGMTVRSQHHTMRSSRCLELAAVVRKTGIDETVTTTATTTDETEMGDQGSLNGRSRPWACSQHTHCPSSRKKAQSIWRTRWAEVGSGARSAGVELYDCMALRHSHLTGLHWTNSWLIRTNASKHLCFFLSALSVHSAYSIVVSWHVRVTSHMEVVSGDTIDPETIWASSSPVNSKLTSTNMVSTRSKTAQPHLEDFATNDSTSKPEPQPASLKNTTPKANTSRKRKPTDTDTKQSPKRTKISSSKSETKPPKDIDNNNDVIIINRAPVLHLWAASVTHLVHPELDWESSLSAGAAVSAICAVAKGRSIGTVPEKDSEDKSRRKKEQDGEEIEVMHFRLRLKGRLCVVGSEEKGKLGGEDALRKKFGEAEYEKVRGVFEEALESWKGEEEELNKRAFGMYEDFRPNVSKGQKGWGRKGELKIEKVRTVVKNQ